MPTDKAEFSRILKAAQYYLSKGYSVIPLKPQDKRPFMPWKEYQDRYPTEREISDWFHEGKNNIGVVTGKISGIAVIDFDTPEAMELGTKLGLPPGPRVKTGKGWHCYCKYSAGVRNFQKRDDLPGIDLRGDGGYVAAPPSIHPNGRVYQFQDIKLPLPELPAWVICDENNPQQKRPITECYHGSETGNRNQTLARLAGVWVKSLSLVECFEMGSTWNTKNDPPLGKDEIEATINSIWNAEKRRKSRNEKVEPPPDNSGSEEPKPEREVKSVEAVLTESGLSALTKESNPDERGNAIRLLGELIKGQDALQRELIRDTVMQHLKAIGVKSPGNLVSSVFDAAKPKKPNGQGQGIIFPHIESWDDPVNSVKLLSSIEAIIRRLVILNPSHLSVLPLWVIHTYCLEACDITPYLNLTSPEKRCGKSLLLDLLARIVYRGQSCSNITPAALFRVIDQWTPTLLIDEIDTFLKDNQELVGILNDGFKLGGKVLRCEGEQNEVKAFGCFCPKVIAGIGSLPQTITDRCITIRMRRKASGEKVGRFDRRAVEDETLTIQRMCFRWSEDNLEKLKHQDVPVLHFLNDRAFDCWRPLLAIALLAGGDWYDRAVEAAKVIGLESEGDDSSIRVNLLFDIKAIFEMLGIVELPSKTICEELAKIDDRPWPEFHHDKPITAAQLAKLLRPFGIRSQSIRTGPGTKDTPKGYKLESFQDAFKIYLPVTLPIQPPHATNQTEREIHGKNDPPQNSFVAFPAATNNGGGNFVAACGDTETTLWRMENQPEATPVLNCGVVAAKTPEKAEAGDVFYEEGVI